MDATDDPNIPQWKRDLIKRLRNKNKWFCDSTDEKVQQLLAGTTSDEVGRTVQQPNLTCSSSSTAAAVVVPVANVNEQQRDSVRKCNNANDKLISSNSTTKMVKDRVIDCDLENNCMSSDNEELHYGPGIVKKLKNHYLSLTLRECNAQVRPSILPLRKATSLENLLEDDIPNNNKPTSTHYSRYQPRYITENHESKNFTNNRYYNASRGVDLKRARSVEAISRSGDELQEPPQLNNDPRLKHQSFHEEMLIIKEGNGVSENTHYDNNKSPVLLTSKETKPFSSSNNNNNTTTVSVNHKINRPKRITPLMSEKEKPPVDVVKQTKRIFEGKAEQRTKQPYQTGDVAAKVASYKNIIQTKNNNKKPPVKQKPEETRTSLQLPLQKKQKPLENGWKTAETNNKKSPPDFGLIPDVSLIHYSPLREENNCSSQVASLSETPDLILHSSPVKNGGGGGGSGGGLYSPGFRISATDNFLKAEIVYSRGSSEDVSLVCNNTNEEQQLDGLLKNNNIIIAAPVERRTHKTVAAAAASNNMSSSTLKETQTTQPYLLPVTTHTTPPPPPPPTCTNVTSLRNNKNHPQIPEKKTDSFKVVSPILLAPLTLQEIEKNHINSIKLVPKGSPSAIPLVEQVDNVMKNNTEVNKKVVQVPKISSSLARKPNEQNSIVFKFTDRRDVPDYVHNDGKIRTGKIEKPKVGEGGIILLPGVSLDESLVDDGDDWMLILEGPPSPCDIEFINGNVVIDGRSSLSKKIKKSKMRIKFVETVPQIYEYPSETSVSSEYTRSTSPLKEPPTVVNNSVPTLTGTSLANYIPKVGSSEEFQLGISRSLPVAPLQSSAPKEGSYQEELEEVEEPVLFSAGTNSDILF